LAINSALTGHLVLSTLHTNSAGGTISRLVDMGAQSFLLVSTLKVIIGQRLVRRLKNKERYFLKKTALKELAKKADLDKVLKTLIDEDILEPGTTWDQVPFYRAVSNEKGNGYFGRIGIQEVLNITETIKNLITEGATTEKVQEQARKEGMLTMLEDGIYKAVCGETTIEEVFRVISE